MFHSARVRHARSARRVTMKAFPPRERQGLYRAIVTQRDARVFRPDAIPDLILARLLQAAQRAPSLGHPAPWKFVIVRDARTKLRMYSIVAKDSAAKRSIDASTEPAPERIREAPLNVCVTYDPRCDERGTHVRQCVRSADLFSVCGAIQNLWLAARAEGLGVAWIDIPHPDSLRQILGIPRSVTPVAYLCVGYSTASAEPGTADNHAAGLRVSLTDLVYANRWGGSVETEAFSRHLRDHGPLA